MHQIVNGHHFEESINKSTVARRAIPTSTQRSRIAVEGMVPVLSIISLVPVQPVLGFVLRVEIIDEFVRYLQLTADSVAQTEGDVDDQHDPARVDES